jgi:hypothetical protein
MARRLLLAAAAAMALLVLASAHTPNVVKSTVKSGKSKWTVVNVVATALPDTQAAVGDRLILDGDVKLDGHGAFRRSAVCTLVDVAAATYLCAVETAFVKGSVLSQGALVLAGGAYTGNLAVVGGTGVFKSVRGIEAVSVEAIKWFLS